MNGFKVGDRVAATKGIGHWRAVLGTVTSVKGGVIQAVRVDDDAVYSNGTACLYRGKEIGGDDGWELVAEKPVAASDEAGEIVRVLRVIEYVGPRACVEEQIRNSLHGERKGTGGCIIKAATVGTFPEILAGAA